MKTIQAHELISADRGVDIVVTTLGFTYVGWFQRAKDLGTREGKRWMGIRLNDSDGRVVTVIVPAEWSLHIEPFPPLGKGDRVARRGYSDPDHKNFRSGSLGTVEGVSRDTAGNRVYRVQWDGEPQSRWHTRRALELAVAAEVTA